MPPAYILSTGSDVPRPQCGQLTRMRFVYLLKESNLKQLLSSRVSTAPQIVLRRPDNARSKAAEGDHAGALESSCSDTTHETFPGHNVRFHIGVLRRNVIWLSKSGLDWVVATRDKIL